MLSNLSIENFKSWKHIPSMRLAPITGMFGPNSSGKTSIIQLLLMLKQTVESPDRAQVLNFGDDRSLVSLGTFGDIVYQHATPATLRWSLRWSLPEQLEVKDPEQDDSVLFSANEMEFSGQVSQNGTGRVTVTDMEYFFGGQRFSMSRKSGKKEAYDLATRPKDGFLFRRGRGRPGDLPAPVKCYGFPDRVKASYQNAEFLADFQLAFEELFSRTYYLGPLREYPRRQYTWAGAQPADMGQRGERVVDALLASREQDKISRGPGRSKTKWTVEQFVADWLRKLGLIHEFRVEPIAKSSNIYRVRVQKSQGASDVLITDVGFGVSQILPVLTLCYYVPEGSTLLLEQPEIHLHPTVQAGLADVFIDAVKRRKIQIVIESHSEHLLRRLQRRIAEEEIKSTDAALYFCTIEGGTSKLTELDVDLTGSIRNWPDGFFGDEYEDIAAMQRANILRKKQGS